MEKGFLNLKIEQKKLSLLILGTGILITLALAFVAYQGTKMLNDSELKKKKAGEGA